MLELLEDEGTRTVGHWIDGKPTPGRSTETLPVWNPATGREQARVLLATQEDVDAAVASAARAAPGWGQASLSARSGVLFAFRELVASHLDELAAIITVEHGKVLADARGELQRGLEVVEFACGLPHLLKGAYSDQVSAGVDSYGWREPLGVVAGITPFNFPAMVPMWMHPVAIACGNAFVLKPSERDPSASLLVAELWARAGLPDGVFSVLQGDARAVDALLDHPGVHAISFVGSTPVARHVHQRATAAGKRVQALGGAKNHAIVLPDADLEHAAGQLIAAGYGSAGQRCMAVSVVVAVDPIADELVEALRRKASALTVGPGDDPASDLGPVITAAARERIAGYVGAGAADGATVVLDGREPERRVGGEGFFLGPSLLDRVTPAMSVYTDEIFGPVLVVVRVPDLDAAIGLVNASPYANGVAIFTGSGEAARRFQRGVQVGMIGINVPIPVPMAYHSFGGLKDSLFGEHHLHGVEGVHFYTRAKIVTSRWPSAPEAATLHFPTAR